MRRIISLLLSVIIVLSCFSCITITSVSAANTADSIVEIARGELGSNNYKKYYGGNENAWCADFVTWCAQQAGVSSIAYSSSCYYMYEGMIKNGCQPVSSPQKGDIVFFYCSKCSSTAGKWCHVGIMEDSTYSIEGNNWTDGTSRVQRAKSYNHNGDLGYKHGDNVGCISRKYLRPNYDDTESTPKMESTRFEYFNNGVRPVIEIENPSAISNVTFYLRFGATAEWKSYSGKYNLDKAWYCEASYDELNGIGDIVCHVYIYGKDGSEQCFVIEKPCVESSRYEFFNNGIRPVVEIENPSSISNVTFYLRYGTTAEWKSYSGKYNLDKAWYCEASYDELNGSGELVCDVYIDGKDGSHEYMSINTETKITNIKEKRFEYFKNGVRPVVSVSNHSKVSKVTFYLRYGKTAKWKTYSGTFNLEDSWYCEALLDDLAGEGGLVCDVYVDFVDGIHQYVGFPIGICKHTYDDGVVTKEATCTSNGVKTYTCSYCSDIYTETIPTALHTEVVDEAVAPDCKNTGLTEGKHCAVCNEVLLKQETVNATGHSWEAATCTAKKTCSTCGATDGNALGHNYTSKVTKEATCTTNGVKTYTCSRCSHSYTESISAKGHSEVITKGYEATCTKDGFTDGVDCSVCNQTVTEQTVIPAKGHKADDKWTTITSSTSCTGESVQVKYCLNCGDVVETKEVNLNGHTVVIDEAVDSTCTTSGLSQGSHCSVCKLVLEPQQVITPVGHNWNDGYVSKSATCTTMGEKTHMCLNCGETKISKTNVLGHKFDDEYIVDKEATCTENGSKSKHCSRCDVKSDVTSIDKREHSYISEIKVVAICTNNGEKILKCNECGNTKTEIINATSHTEVIDNAVAPTCTEIGLTEGKHCSVCNKVLVAQATVEATSHSTKTVGVKKATYFAKGNTGNKVCKTCGKIVSKGKTIAQLKLKTPKVTIKGGKKKLTVKYTKVKGATGFQIKYKIGKKNVTKTYTTKKTATKAISKLKKGNYKVYVRAFVKQGSKKAYSSWTKAKSVKVK